VSSSHDFYNLGPATARGISELISTSTLSIPDGGILDEFETRAAAFFGHRFGVATCNGTAAIHSALFAIDLKPGDEVIVPTYGFHAMVTPILQLGARPVFCDIYADSLSIDVERAANLLTPRTRAILVLHPWGNPADLGRLQRLARQRDVYLISDSSHAHGATWRGRPLGKFCDLLCASFGKGKLITGGELGIATTDDPRLRDRMLLFGHVNRVPRAYLTDCYKDIGNAIGIKYRPHPFALRLALDQMDTYAERSRRLLANVGELLAAIHGASLRTQASFPESGRVFWHVVVMAEPSILGRLRNSAAAAGLVIEDNHYHPLLHENPIVTRYYRLPQPRFPVAEEGSARIVQIEALQFWDCNTAIRYAEAVRSCQEGCAR
jgi:dTDP-4-amino-4,6-dideoxygalactose transaminase